jgi:hypothetical protein
MPYSSKHDRNVTRFHVLYLPVVRLWSPTCYAWCRRPWKVLSEYYLRSFEKILFPNSACQIQLS